MEQITEDMHIHEQWYEDAKNQTLKTLPEFLRHLTNDYEHDYGTICHALAAGAVATTWAMNHSKQGGITGFQAWAIMWEFIMHWTHKEPPLALIEYKNMLCPYHAHLFTTISASTWDFLQQEAKKILTPKWVLHIVPHTGLVWELEPPRIHRGIRRHLESIIEGKVPFGYTVIPD